MKCLYMYKYYSIMRIKELTPAHVVAKYFVENYNLSENEINTIKEEKLKRAMREENHIKQEKKQAKVNGH